MATVAPSSNAVNTISVEELWAQNCLVMKDVIKTVHAVCGN